MPDRDQQEAQRALAHDAQGLVTLFNQPVRRHLAVKVRRALDGCPDYRAALRRHHAHRQNDMLVPPPLFRQVDRLIADLNGADGGAGR